MTCYNRSLAPDKHKTPHTGRGSDSLVLIEAGGFYPNFYGILLYVAKQNFKISTSEYLRCASKCAISRLNNQKFSVEGAVPPPQKIFDYLIPDLSPGEEGDTPSPHPTPPSAPRYGPQTKMLPTPLLRQ